MRGISDIGAAVIGSGFIGSVHIEALRRLGVQIHGLLEVSPERGAKRPRHLGLPQAYESIDDDARGPAGRGRPRHLAERAPPPPGAGRSSRAGKHVVCEKPLAMTSRSPPNSCASPRAAGVVDAVNFNIRFYPLTSTPASGVRGGRPRRGPPRVTGQLLPGLAPPRHRLELAARPAGGRRAAGRRRHRHRTGWTSSTLRHRPARSRRVADLATFVHRSASSPTGAVETFSTERDATPTVEPVEIDDRGRGRDPPPLRGRGAGSGRDLPGERRPQELPAVRDRRLGGGGGLGLGAARRAVDRPARRARTRSCSATRPS